MVSVCNTTCGDGYVTFDEECDLGNMNGKLQQGCTSRCKVATGFNCNKNLNWTSICTPYCGDKLVVGSETCDLGTDLNGKNGTGCSDKCTVIKGFYCNISFTPTVCTSICGDGIMAGNESCDLGDQFNGNINEGCSKECSTIIGFLCKSDEFQHSTCRT
jgi:cysteine-rich repeat protein